MKKVVWGCCWYNEETDTVIHFLKETTKSFHNSQIEIIPVIFVANTKIEDSEVSRVKDNIPSIVVFRNQIDIYPNKNYGIYAIVNYAHKLGVESIAVVDPDWSIQESKVFVETVLQPILDNKADLVIPNIGNAAGRSNILVGKSITELFYPEYKDIILTPFAGSFTANTNQIYPIINSINYHFDWGGEWDIISYAIKNQLRVISVDVDVLNVRHRKNSSKIQDSYQIWRAAFSNPDMKTRFYYLLEYQNEKVDNHLQEELSKEELTIDEMISIISHSSTDSTERQLLYMVLYPLSCLIHNEVFDYTIIDDKNDPYNKNKIPEIGKLAVYCIQKSIKNSNMNIDTLIENANHITGSYFGSWDSNNRAFAKEKINSQMEEIL